MKPVQLIRISGLVMTAALATAGAARAEPGPIVYIPTGDSAEVMMIDASTNELLGQIAGLPAAHGLAVTPDGGRLIVGSFDEREPGTVMPDKPEGVSATDHAAHHAPGPSAGMQPTVSTLSIVDTATRSVVQRLDVPGAVHHVAVSPDGRVAVVTHPTGNAITAVDLDELAVIATVETGVMPNYAAFSSDGSELYVGNAGEDTVAVLNTSTWTVAGKIETGRSPEHLVLSPDGRRLFVNNVDDGSVSVIDLSQGLTVETLPIGTNLHGIDISDDGGTLFVVARGDDKVVALDLADGSRRSFTLSPAPYHLNVIRGTGLLYISSAAESVVWAVDAATLETRGRIPLSGIGHQFAQTPQG